MIKKAIVLHPDDNVATVLERTEKGDELKIEREQNDIETIIALTEIKFLHKIAIKDIPAGCPIIKYGQIIGKATQDIQKGIHVHTKNVKSWFYS